MGRLCSHKNDLEAHLIREPSGWTKKHPPLHICPARCGRKFGGKIPNNRQNEVAENPLAGRAEGTTKKRDDQQVASTRSAGTLHVALQR